MKTLKTAQDILDLLEGSGEDRKPTAEFWELREQCPKTLNRLRFKLWRKDGEWLVDVSKVDPSESIAAANAAIRKQNRFYSQGCWRDVDGH